MKIIKKHWKKILIIFVIVLYLFRFCLGVVGIPGPYIGYQYLSESDAMRGSIFDPDTYKNIAKQGIFTHRIKWNEFGFSTDGKMPK